MAQVGAFSSEILDNLQKTFGFSRDGVVWVNEKGQIIAANVRLSEFLSYTPEALSRLPIFAINPHLNLFAWKKIWRSLQSGEMLQEDTELMNASGMLIPMRTYTHMLTIEGEEQAMIVVENLLTARQLPDLLEAITQAGQIGAWELDLTQNQFTFFGETLRWLQLSLELSSMPREELLAQLKGYLSEAESDRLQQAVRNAILHGQSFEVEVAFYDKAEDTYTRFIVSGRPVQSELQTIKVYGTVRKAAFQATDDIQAYLAGFSLDRSDELIFWIKPGDKFVFANQSVVDLLGYTRSEIKNLAVSAILQEDDGADQYWEQLRTHQQLEREVKLITRAGDVLPVLSSIYYIQHQDQEFACIIAKDSSDQHRQARQLQLTQFAIENSRDMILWIRPNGAIAYANTAFTNVTGYQPEEVKELNLYELYRDKGETLDRAAIWEQLRAEKGMELEVELKIKNNNSIPVYCTLNYIRYQDQEFECVFMRNWQKKKARDMKLLLAQNTLDTAGDMIFWIDEDLEIKYSNPASLKVLGYSKEQLKNKSIALICPKKNLGPLLDAGKRTVGELIFITRQEKEVPVEVSISPVSYQGITYQCLIARDVAERKRREMQLKAKQEKIHELSARLKDENILLKAEISADNNTNNIVTQSKDYHKVLDQVAQVADTDATVLILGETGTGKELLARAIYKLSDRDEKPLIKVNCAALPENLIESELFGHEKGAFTGALQQKKGRFELANGGTIFLDEIGEMPLDLQSKLLRVLQEGEFERLGGTTTIEVDVRIIAATNRNLEKMVDEGTFREDLFYRLNVFPIINPPLRHRREDIPLLVRHFAKKYGERMGKKIEKISQADIDILMQYDFPGNIRELENIVERAVILAKDGALNLRASFDRVREQSNRKGKSKQFLSFEEMQREHIIEALRQTNWRITGPQGAAKLLDLKDRTLMSKMRKLEIHRKDFI